MCPRARVGMIASSSRGSREGHSDGGRKIQRESAHKHSLSLSLARALSYTHTHTRVYHIFAAVCVLPGPPMLCLFMYAYLLPRDRLFNRCLLFV